MKKKVDELTKECEAANLLSLMVARGFGENHADFAKKAKRTRAELSQHLKTERPIPLSAVKSYASLLECSIREISPRWADELSIESDGVVAKSRPLTKREQRIEEIVALLQKTNIEGLAVMLERAKDAVRDYPLAKETRK
jgi:hypothetical protein